MRMRRRAVALLLALAGAPAGVAAQDSAPGLLPEPRLLDKAMRLVARTAGDGTTGPGDGFYPEFGHMITGAGWIAIGPGYRHHVLNGQAIVDVSTAISWRTYKIAQARFEFPALSDNHLTLGSQVLWRDFTQINYFGRGTGSRAEERSDYRLQASEVVAYAAVRPNPTVSLTTSVGLLGRPDLSSSTGTFDRDLPDTLALFPEEPAAQLTQQPGFLHATVALAADTRDHRGHPASGGLYRAAWVGYRDLEAGTFTFERYETEAAHFLPFLGGRSVLALHGLAVFSTAIKDRDIPFYLMPSLGGGNTLRGYSDYRFHDRDVLVVNAESRWALFTHVDAALFVDAGNVAARAADLDLSRTSYGVGVRVHTGRSTLLRCDAARGGEGWHFVIKMTDPFRLARLSRHTAAIPFVP